MIEVTELKDLDRVLEDNDRVVVVFSAKDWCMPCKRLSPHLKAASERLSDVTFVEVDIDRARDIQHEYDIMSVPTVIAYTETKTAYPVVSRTAPALIAEISAL